MILDSKYIVNLLLTVATLAVPIWIWQIDSTRSLNLRLASSVSLQPEQTSAIEDLQIVIGGKKVKSPYLSTLELTNDGSKAITSSDFEGPIEIIVDQDVKIVRARLSSTEPKDLQGELRLVENSARLSPLLLNPKDKLTFAIITSGKPPKFDTHERIKGISKITYEDATIRTPSWRDYTLYPLASLFGLMLYCTFAIALFRPNLFKVSRLLAVVTMITSAVGGSMTLRHLVQVFDLHLNFIIISVVVAIVGVFVGVYATKRGRN